MIRIQKVSKGYGGQTLFNEIEFQLEKGQRLGVCGRNGHGKSTLFRLITKEEVTDSGEIFIPRGYQIGQVKQHLNFTKPTPLEEAALALGPDREDQLYLAEKILCGLGFKTEDLYAPIENFSGGFQIRINLAKVLIEEPDLLLLDEPTNYLDIVAIRWLTRFLRGWKGEMMLITHDREFMDSVTTHTLAIHRAGVRFVKGSSQKLYDQIVQEEEIHEKTRQNQERKNKQTQEFIDRFRSKATKSRQVQSRIKTMAKQESLQKLANIEHLDFSFPNKAFRGKCLLEADDIEFGYDEPLIKNLSLQVNPGDRIGVIGKNGKGKSTLLKVLAKELSPQKGECRPHLHCHMSYFGQTNIDRLHPEMTVEDEIQAACPQLDRTSVRKLCGTMLFSGDAAEKKIQVLSGGERSRVLLGKILAHPSNLLLLDEPTNHLDQESIEALASSIDEYEGGVLLVTHTESLLHRLCNKLLVFQGDNVQLFDGDYALFLERIGWNDEKDVAEKRPSKKNERKARAEALKLRNEKLRPLKKEMNKLESSLEKAESEISEFESRLTLAVQDQQSHKIQSLSKELADKRKQTDLLYQQLETIMTEMDAIC